MNDEFRRILKYQETPPVYDGLMLVIFGSLTLIFKEEIFATILNSVRPQLYVFSCFNICLFLSQVFSSFLI